ncbi:MAG: hypothetical protein V4683_02085 [Bacteroidota bacterium]
MDKEMLIKSIKSKSADRKRLLFYLYEDLINSKITVKNIIVAIHNDLGEENLIEVRDIEYCRRRYCHKKMQSNPKTFRKYEHNKFNGSLNINELTWTNPDEISIETVKSKFAK